MTTNFSMIRGDTKRIDVSASIDGQPIDMTGTGKAWMSARRFPNSPQYVFQKSSPSSGISITNGVGGLFTVTISPGDTEALPAEPVTLYYDIQVRSTTGEIYTVTTGTISVSPDITVETT